MMGARHIIRCAALSLCFVLISCDKQAQVISTKEVSSQEFYLTLIDDLPKIKNYVLSLEPTIGQAQTVTEKARLISNFIYNFITVTTDDEGLSLYEPFNSLTKMGEDKEIGYICGGISIFYMYVLMAFGIESRYVALFSDVNGNFNSHASVEFYDGERWLASDATFNLVWVDNNGNLLSYEEVFNKRANSDFYTHEYNSVELKPIINLEYQNLFYNTDDFFNYIAVYPSNDVDNTLYLCAYGEWDGWVYAPLWSQWMNISQSCLFLQINKAFQNKQQEKQ